MEVAINSIIARDGRYRGIGERILGAHGVAVMVLDSSSYGDSIGCGTVLAAGGECCLASRTAGEGPARTGRGNIGCIDRSTVKVIVKVDDDIAVKGYIGGTVCRSC